MNETMEMKLRDVADYVDTLKVECKDQEVKRSYLIHTLHKAQEIIGLFINAIENILSAIDSIFDAYARDRRLL